MSYYGPPQQYQQYPQQQYQQYPPTQQPPGYGPQYGPPRAAKPKSIFADPMIISGLVMVIIGSILLMVAPFLNWRYVEWDIPGTNPVVTINVTYSGVLAYGYLMLVFGILMLLFSMLILFVKSLQKKNYFKLPWILGIIGLVIAILFSVHTLTYSMPTFTYYGVPVDISPTENSIGPGLFLALIGAVLGITGGVLLTQKLSKLQPATTGPPGVPPYGQPQTQYPPQQYPQQQYPQQQYPQQQYPPQQPPPYGSPPGQ